MFSGAQTTDESFLHQGTAPCTRTARTTSRRPFHETLRFIVGEPYYIHDRRPVASVFHDIWPSFPSHFTAFYVQAGEYILLRAPDMLSAFDMDPQC